MRQMMFSGLAAVLIAGVLAAPGKAAEGPIQDVIDRQLRAFQADDFDTAFTFASPMIQGMFRTPEVFGQMVQRGYPMVHRPGEVTFLDLREDAGRLRQTVRILDGAGQVHLLEYEMIPSEDGWRINGVRFIPQPDVGA